MEKAFSFFLLIVLLLLHYVMASSAMTKTNITTDQLALLSLKSQIISDPSHFLNESWIPREFGNLSFLVCVDLGSNNFHGNLPQEMQRLHRLKFLDLSSTASAGRFPLGMKVLSIQCNYLTGSIPLSVFNISRIEIIAFTGNSLSGSLHNGLCNGIPILQGLYLSENKLHGQMPTSLSNFSHLQILSLSYNEFDGPIHSEIGRLSNLQMLELGSNQFTGEIPKEKSNLVELEVLNLGFNSFSGSLDMETFNISGLRIIDLSFNNLSGSLTPNLGSILPSIEELYLNNLTNLVGIIPHSMSNCSKLTRLELSINKLAGLIPNSLGSLAHLQYLTLAANNLTSDSSLSFLTSLTNCRNLTALSLSLNPLNGMLPAFTGNLSTSL
ncbi:hypothetical protein P3S67_013559 [Capsicum chacoense]